MLNPFPIQFLSMLAYTLLRIIVGSLLLVLGIRHASSRNADTSLSLPLILLSLLEMGVGLMYLVGWYTQYAALLTFLIVGFSMLLRRSNTQHTFPGAFFYTLLCGAALSLFITGAGAFAFDLPI